jgi:hypothetical protein
MALSNIGTRSTIASFDENSTEAKECKLWYDFSRTQALEAFDWSFARRRLALALHGDDAPEMRWSFRYQYPANCIAARYIENPLGPTADAVPFEIELSEDGNTKSLLTNQEDAVLVYTSDMTQTTMYTSHFVETLSHLLAFHIAIQLTGKRSIKSDMAQMYSALLRAAPAQNANERVGAPPREAEWIRSRG